MLDYSRSDFCPVVSWVKGGEARRGPGRDMNRRRTDTAAMTRRR